MMIVFSFVSDISILCRCDNRLVNKSIQRDVTSEVIMRTLVVEDNVINSKYMFNLLKPYGEVDIAESGLVAVEMFAKSMQNSNRYDLICLDVMMPEMDGQETLQRIRTLEAENGIHGLDGVKIIMTTAMDDKRTILQSFKGGCESFLIKPIDKKSLLDELVKLSLMKGDSEPVT